ncbi:type IV pilus assembly protein PilM [Patescibacteria group bacterium]|nr:type IV pilus assembly protein PilM [Patescibacteria group bacterium]
MGFFSKAPQKQSYIGLDIGMSGIKLVELMNEKGRARLVTYAYSELPTTFERAFTDDADKMATFLKKMIAQAKCTTKTTISALPISSVFSSIISVPAANEKELKEAILWQAKKLIPVPLEEISLDSKTIDSASGSEAGKKVTRVLLTGAPKNLVDKYISLMKKVGLELISLETEAFAQIRSLIGKDRSSIMVIDIGAARTNISIIERGIPFLNRSIATGGLAITQTISKTLSITAEQAEAMKRDIRAMQTFAQAGDLNPILTTLLKPILDEIRYSFNLYQGQTEDGQQKRIDKIILTGGGALLPNLPEFLTSLMNVNTYLGDPWARIVYPTDLRPILDEIGPRFSVSIGCAMRDIE